VKASTMVEQLPHRLDLEPDGVQHLSVTILSESTASLGEGAGFDEAERRLRAIAGEAQRLKALVDDMLDMAPSYCEWRSGLCPCLDVLGGAWSYAQVSMLHVGLLIKPALHMRR
jgi:hypothetical protein